MASKDAPSIPFKRRVSVVLVVFAAYIVFMGGAAFFEDVTCGTPDCRSPLLGFVWELEDANILFRDHYGAWPPAVAHKPGAMAAAVLASNDNTVMKFDYQGVFKNFIPQYALVAGKLQHPLGGVVEQFPGKYLNRKVLLVRLHNVPMKDAKQVDEHIDGIADGTKGRVQYGTSNPLTLTYVANFVD